MILDWNAIRPLNGGRDKGFEELCAQLARVEAPVGSQFERKAPPDAGIECYATLDSGLEWGWQAKYFGQLGNSQWSQISRSVTKALEKHPRLTRYYVCVPLDLSDARVSGQKSAREKWDDHVARWANLARARDMVVEFVYWGSHELLDRLAQPQHVGRLRFWFEVRGFDREWFAARLEEAIHAAGPRYTPEIHVGLPIAWEFEAFGRTPELFDRVKGHARRIREKQRSVKYAESKGADTQLNAAVVDLSSKVETVLSGLGALELQPTGSLPFAKIAEHSLAAEAVVVELARELAEREHDEDAKKRAKGESEAPFYRSNPFSERRYALLGLGSALREAHKALENAGKMAGVALMLLRGAAGTGKTHLLCDVARRRVASGQPTVLLMGQRFVSLEEPWSQALQQLDMVGFSAEEFVGALEAAAQSAGSRALLMIDAMNEGTGRVIWPSHLAAFLAHVNRSPWIAVVMAVRSSYETIVVPPELQSRCVTVTHQGFAEHEYDATQAFFLHYGLEFPSTPLLAPEFRNPLFLKTLCSGLKTKGERRLPRGFHGVTAVLDLYLGAINAQLASVLDFNPRAPLVRRALEAFVQALNESGERWLRLEKAAGLVDALLPNRDFDRSLFRGLVVEGVLVEEASIGVGGGHEEIVFVAYERFADHLTAKWLLDRHLDGTDPSIAFAAGGPLAFVGDDRQDVSPGLIEALCVQVPERTGRELLSVAPACGDRWALGEAFRQSLIWRAYSAFTDETVNALRGLCRTKNDLRDTNEVILTVASLPGHPLNASFLNKRLRQDTMPDRDAWWSVLLHEAWGSRGAVDRLVDWGLSVEATTRIDEETVDLCAIALCWMFTSSNRFLRDRATKALVSLLTGRLASVVRLVDGFFDVNDPYVAERLYAVAYGAAMRSNDPVAVGSLAARVYAQVFEGGSPAPDILLRDYARGVVERALYLRSPINVDVGRIRPPYRSRWPAIPTEEQVRPYVADWSRGSHDSGELEWARNRIGSSIMGDDFGRYVIGTNSSATSSTWLSLRLEEPRWIPPPRPEDRLRSVVAKFSDVERMAWEEFGVADEAYADASKLAIAEWFTTRENEGDLPIAGSDLYEIHFEIQKSLPPEMALLETRRERALSRVEASLTSEHLSELQEIQELLRQPDRRDARPPSFSLAKIQRYVLWRVFDLGWTVERFGHFDRFLSGYYGRSAAKAERIGKKYQWIAYHEILALIADNFQYRERYGRDDCDTAYEGPWQDSLRDIDPSCTIRAIPGGTSWEGHAISWWGPVRYERWGNPDKPRDWILDCEGLPKVEDLLLVVNPTDGSRWVNCQGHLDWKQRGPADRDPTDVERRDLWYTCSGYLIRRNEAAQFLTWAEGVDSWGRWMPDAAEISEMFLGEHAWAPVSRYFERPYYGDDGWTQPRNDCPVKIRAMAVEYMREASGFDCSVDDGYKLRLPVKELVVGLGIQWAGIGADFTDGTGRVASQDPTAHGEGPSALLLREDLLQDYLASADLAVCWTVWGEKRILSPGYGSGLYHPELELTGAYVLEGDKLIGFVKGTLRDRDARGEAGPTSIEVFRSGPRKPA